MVIFGSMLGAVCCFLMPVAGSLGVLIGVWAANGLFQSMLWSPILRVFSETIDESLSKKAILNIALSLPVGTVLAYLMSSMIIKYLNWKYVFIFEGSVVVIAVLFAGFAIFCSEKDIEKVPVIQKQNAEAHNNVNKKRFGGCCCFKRTVIYNDTVISAWNDERRYYKLGSCHD